jgi:hypothetical protein
LAQYKHPDANRNELLAEISQLISLCINTSADAGFFLKGNYMILRFIYYVLTVLYKMVRLLLYNTANRVLLW